VVKLVGLDAQHKSPDTRRGIDSIITKTLEVTRMGIKPNVIGQLLLKVPPTSPASERETIPFSFHLTSHILDSVLSEVMLSS
jgi:hypothetical protein